MGFAPGDLEFRYSTVAATGGNTTSGSAGASLGKYVSQTPIVNATMANLFPRITGEENAAANVDYQCIFFVNLHPALTYNLGKIWISDEDPGVASIAFALDNLPPSNANVTTYQAAYIADKNVAPTNVGSFSTATTKGTATLMPDVPPGHVQAIWLRRSAIATMSLTSDSATIRVEQDLP